jgi:hypothetical protein
VTTSELHRLRASDRIKCPTVNTSIAIRVPSLIKERLVGRGAFVGLTITAFAAVATAAAFGWKGIIALAGLLLLAAVADFWRELVTVESRLDSASRERDTARAEASEADVRLAEAAKDHEDELEEAREEYRKLRTEALAVEQQNTELKRAADASHVSLKKLLAAAEAQVQAIERAERGRLILARLGTNEWPAVSLSPRNGFLEVIAYVETGAAELDGEAVALVSKQLGGVLATTSAKSHSDRQILAVFRTNDISRLVRRRFSSSREIDPDPFTLRLQGFAEATPLSRVSDNQLTLLKNALRELQAAIASALVSPEGEEDQ